MPTSRKNTRNQEGMVSYVSNGDENEKLKITRRREPLGMPK